MKKILIATKNKDKFKIVKNILSSSEIGQYEYFSLYDIKGIDKDSKEEGNIENRAYNKAKEIFDNIDNNEFEYILGIDDGIEMKNKMIPNIKDYLDDIINNNYLDEGEVIYLLRAYCFMDKSGNTKKAVIKIPYKYMRNVNGVDIKMNTYPLSSVLTPIDSDLILTDMDEEKRNMYYLKYSQQSIKQLFNNNN